MESIEAWGWFVMVNLTKDDIRSMTSYEKGRYTTHCTRTRVVELERLRLAVEELKKKIYDCGFIYEDESAICYVIDEVFGEVIEKKQDE